MDNFIIILGLTIACLASTVMSFGFSNYLNVIDFGAVGNGKTDDSNALLRAWSAACSSNALAPAVVVPKGKTLLLYPPIEFRGPCNSPKIGILILGNLLAPPPAAWNGIDKKFWLLFTYVNGMTIAGNGMIHGRGSEWWNNLCKTNNKQGCFQQAPMILSILKCRNVRLYDLTFVDPPFFHIHMWDVSSAVFRWLTFRAPGDSPNTVGMHLAQCRKFRLFDLDIGTGDDCIAIDDKTSNVIATRVKCGPGHGISIGSLGKNGASAAVENIILRSVNFVKTFNGARIKTWQGGKGYAKNIRFEGMTFDRVYNPIIIDQYYCGGATGCSNKSSAVGISDVSFIGGYGTSSGDRPTISLLCSQAVPCTGIIVQGVTIKSAGSAPSKAECINAYGSSLGAVVPYIPCLG